jgi:predicted metalloprotease with PDZ domain
MKKKHIVNPIKLISKLSTYFFFFLMIGNLAGTTRQKVTYSLEVDEEKWNSFYVSITIENNRNNQLLCVMPSWAPGVYANSNFYEDISEFQVVGDVVPDLEAIKTNKNSWLINAKKNNLIIISYKLKRAKDNILGECIGKDFAWVNNATTFLYIRELENVPINLVVNVPFSWKLATGLSPSTEDFEYSAINYYQLIQHPIYMGTFSDLYFSIRKGNGFFLLDGPNNFNAGKLPVITKQIATYQTYLLMSQPLERYLFICKIIPDQTEIKSLAFQNSSIFYLPTYSIKNDISNVGKIIGSSFFKRWFGPQFLLNSFQGSNLIYKPRTTLLWFTEGICDYYGSLSMIRGGFWSQEDFLNHYLMAINKLFRNTNYLIPSVADLSYNIFESNYKETKQILALKGELLCLLMDLRIRNNTNNQKNIDDVVRFIKNWFDNEQITFTEDYLLTTLNSITSIDFTNFFDQYINGNMELPFAEYFSNAGITIESKTDTIPDLGKIVIDESNKVIQLSHETPLDLAGLKERDFFLAMNNTKFRGNSQLLQTIDSLQVGSEAEITIRREGLSLVISAKVAGKEVKVVNLKSIDEETERSKLIRESWLSGRRLKSTAKK